MKASYQKYSFWAFMSFAAALYVIGALFSSFVRAVEPISTHSRQDKGIEKALQLCRKRGGELSWTQVELNRLYDDPVGYRLYGDELLFVCKVSIKQNKIKISWSKPSSREDGTLLKDAEIKGYQLDIDGEIIMVSNVTEYITGEVGFGVHKIRLSTVDIDNQVGKFSDEIIVNVQ